MLIDIVSKSRTTDDMVKELSTLSMSNLHNAFHETSFQLAVIDRIKEIGWSPNRAELQIWQNSTKVKAAFDKIFKNRLDIV